MENEHINPWSQIWVHPRKTLRSILSTDPQKVIVWLAIIGGILAALTYLLSINVDAPFRDKVLRPLPFIAILVGGGIIGLIHLYFGGWLYQLTGGWIGGKGSFTDVKCAVGWSNYPYIIASLFALLSIWAMPYLWLQIVFGLLNFIVVIWGLVIFLHLIAEAHQFSIWKGILTVLIACALIFAVFMIIGLLVPLLMPLFQ